jgi:thioredoxin-dependent peroxiredoxin
MKLEIGQKAPAINTVNQRNEPVQLRDFLGKKVVLYFYPKDNTPTCTTQACNLRDHHEALLAKGYTVLGVSIDNAKSHQKFIDKHQLPFDLLVDIDQKIVNDYHVWVEKTLYGRKYMGTARTTFLIDEKGEITDIIEGVKSKIHHEQILK